MLHKTTFLSALTLATLSACRGEAPVEPIEEATPHAAQEVEPAGALATFAGGCFWCMETPFEELPGVTAVISGYTGGQVQDPTYQQVCAGTTGHAEAIQIHFDPSRISYDSLLEVFWRQIDPTDAGGQFVDRGTQYRAEIFFHDDEQQRVALASRQRLAESGRFSEPIVTQVVAFERFWEAESYHQDFSEKSPKRYKSYRRGSGRDQFCDRTWRDERELHPTETKIYEMPSEEELRERLTPLQYLVTQEAGTEPPFKNEYWDNHEAGIYVDIVSGAALFSSTDKYDSGSGWPCFTSTIEQGRVTFDTDFKLGYQRTEVRSTQGEAHLGHVFDDGPAPTGKRYCINSAAVRFIPATELEQQGYGAYKSLFEE